MNLSPFYKVAGIALLLGQTAFAQTQVTPAGEMEVGPTSQNQVKRADSNSPAEFNHSGAIGFGNWVSSQGSLAVGANNQVGYNPVNWWGNWTGHYSLAVGSGNIIQDMYAATIGYGNYNSGSASLIVGSNNSIPFQGEDPSGSHSLVVGMGNQNYGTSFALISGFNCGTWGGEASATLGRGLINWWSAATVVGRYNLAQGLASDPLFVVGNGNGIANDANERTNALEVYPSGAVIIPKRQGDIRMGEFGLNGD